MVCALLIEMEEIFGLAVGLLARVIRHGVIHVRVPTCDSATTCSNADKSVDSTRTRCLTPLAKSDNQQLLRCSAGVYTPRHDMCVVGCGGATVARSWPETCGNGKLQEKLMLGCQFAVPREF